MDRNKYLFNYVLILRFAVHQLMSFQCNQQNMLTPNLTVGEINFLVKNESYIDVEVYGNLHLKCEGIEPFSWVLPEYHPHYDQYPDFIQINTTRSGNKYLSELLLKEIVVQDVGYYSCNYNKSLEGDVETLRNKYNSIYVFVTDINNLFVSEFSTIPAVNNSEVHINCKPSSSFTQITLWEVNQYNHSILEEMVISPQNGITFDPKLGFQLENLKANKIQCIAKLNDTTNKLNISFQFSSRIEYEPILYDNNITFVFVGDNFTLNCKIILTDSSVLSLKWDTKQICTKDWKQRLTIGELTTTPIGSKKLQMNRNISVTNAHLTDQGIYKCIAYDLADKQKEVTKIIKIYESAKLELKADVDDQVLTCNQQFIFNVTISSVPNEEKALNLFWIKDGVIITQNSDHFIITRNLSEFTSLTINDLEIDDSGVYTLSANLLNTLYSNVSLNLTVNGCRSPFITKKKEERYDIVGNNGCGKDQIVLIIVFIVSGGVLLLIPVIFDR